MVLKNLKKHRAYFLLEHQVSTMKADFYKSQSWIPQEVAPISPTQKTMHGHGIPKRMTVVCSTGMTHTTPA